MKFLKDFFAGAGYFILAAALLLLEALFCLLVWLPWSLWEKLSYTAQCLRYPGGGWGRSMAEGARARMQYPSDRDSRR